MMGVETAAAQTARRRRLSGVALVLAVLVLGGGATTAAALVANRSQQQLATQEMDHYIDDLSDVITEQVNDYGDALTDLAAGISAQQFLSAGDFATMASSLDNRRLPGATGVGFVVAAADDEVAAVQAHWRSHGATGLTLVAAGTGVEHKFVIFSHSFTATGGSPGRDLSQVQQTEDVLRISRETGAFTIGHPLVLYRDRNLPSAQQQLSFTLGVPVQSRSGSAAAWVVMGVRGRDFLNQTVGRQAAGAIRMDLIDPAVGSDALIAQVSGGKLMPDRSLERTRTLALGHHTWQLRLRPTTGLLSVTDRWATRLAIAVGAAFTLLLATLVAVLVSGRNRAMDRVDEATAALREDIRRREAVEAELQRLALHDPLTGLANRVLFYERVGHALTTHARAGETFAVLFIDLDGFKQVNDRFGHSAGDAVLRTVADRLSGCLRDSDTVARFGGDEFAVVVERLAAPGDVQITAERIVTAVGRPIEVGSNQTRVTASVGIALNHPGDSADDILREADLAMYTAKTTGKSRHVLAGRQRLSDPADSIEARAASSRATGTRNGEQDT
ncbi:MAG TPA: GGDEF domain-containing protein [Actinoplanes sp.]